MMTLLLLCAYCIGIVSFRKIVRDCHEALTIAGADGQPAVEPQ